MKPRTQNPSSSPHPPPPTHTPRQSSSSTRTHTTHTPTHTHTETIKQQRNRKHRRANESPCPRRRARTEPKRTEVETQGELYLGRSRPTTADRRRRRAGGEVGLGFVGGESTRGGSASIWAGPVRRDEVEGEDENRVDDAGEGEDGRGGRGGGGARGWGWAGGWGSCCCCWRRVISPISSLSLHAQLAPALALPSIPPRPRAPAQAIPFPSRCLLPPFAGWTALASPPSRFGSFWGVLRSHPWGVHEFSEPQVKETVGT